MKTAAGLPPALRVKLPVSEMLDADLYTPETRVVPPRSAEIVVKAVRPAASR
jgi:hypothetical protein